MDSQSLTGALPAYERAGMRVVRQSMRYEKELRPGIDLTTRELSARRQRHVEGHPIGVRIHGCAIAPPDSVGPIA